MTLDPGWRPDPYGRFAQRWWDGADWTDKVRTGGVDTTDPLGTSTSIPFATPESAIVAPVVGRPWWQRLAFWRK